MLKVSLLKETDSRCKSDRRNYSLTQRVKECSSEAISSGATRWQPMVILRLFVQYLNVHYMQQAKRRPESFVMAIYLRFMAVMQKIFSRSTIYSYIFTFKCLELFLKRKKYMCFVYLCKTYAYVESNLENPASSIPRFRRTFKNSKIIK